MPFYPLADVDWNAPRAATLFRNLPVEVRDKIIAHREREEEREEASITRSRIHSDQTTEYARLKSEVSRQENLKKSFGEMWTAENQFDLDADIAKVERLAAKLHITPLAPTDKSKINRAREFQSLNTPAFEDWFRKISPATARFKYAPASTKGWTVDKIRAAIDDEINGRRAVVLLPATLEDAIAAANASVDRMASQGAPDLRDTIRSASDVEWPKDTFFVKDLSASIETQYGTSFLCWLDPDAVKKKLAAEIRTKFNGTVGISAKDRRDKLAVIDAKWLELQRIEEAVCDAVEAKGQTVDRRILHPLAMMQVEQIQDAPANEIVRPDVTQDFPTQGARNWADAEDMPIKGGIGYVPRATTSAAEE